MSSLKYTYNIYIYITNFLNQHLSIYGSRILSRIKFSVNRKNFETHLSIILFIYIIFNNTNIQSTRSL